MFVAEHYSINQSVGSQIKHRMQMVKNAVTGAETNQPVYKANVQMRLQLETLKSFSPWFIAVMTTIQLITVLIQIGLGGIAPISFSDRHVMACKSSAVMVQWFEMYLVTGSVTTGRTSICTNNSSSTNRGTATNSSTHIMEISVL